MSADPVTELGEAGMDCSMSACALAYVTQPETWPDYLAWLRSAQPEASSDYDDEQLRALVVASGLVMDRAALDAQQAIRQALAALS